jgi:hypothetical protein
MALVHVVSCDSGLELLENHVSAYAEHCLLGDACVPVSPVKILCNQSVFGSIDRKIGVQKIYRDPPAANADLIVFPYPYVDFAAGYGDIHRERELLHVGARVKIRIELLLLPERIYELNEVTPLVEERDRHKGYIYIRCGFYMVPCENPEPAAIGGNVLAEADFHAEIGDFHQ